MDQIVNRPGLDTSPPIEAALGLGTAWQAGRAGAGAAASLVRRSSLLAAASGVAWWWTDAFRRAGQLRHRARRKGCADRRGLGHRHAAAADPGRHLERIVRRRALGRRQRKRQRQAGRRARRARHDAHHGQCRSRQGVRSRSPQAQARPGADDARTRRNRPSPGPSSFRSAAWSPRRRWRPPPPTRDRATASVAVARANLAIAAGRSQGSGRPTSQKSTIYAPIDGIVLTRSVDPGQTVASSLQAPILFVIAADLEEDGAQGRDRRGRHRRASPSARTRASRSTPFPTAASTPRSATSPSPRSPPRASSPTTPGSTSTMPSFCCAPA